MHVIDQFMKLCDTRNMPQILACDMPQNSCNLTLHFLQTKEEQAAQVVIWSVGSWQQNL